MRTDNLWQDYKYLSFDSIQAWIETSSEPLESSTNAMLWLSILSFPRLLPQ